jgi:hypothetical protein
MLLPYLQTLELVPLYARIKPFDPSLEFELPEDSTDDLANEDFEFASSLVVLSETKCLDLINKFCRDADAYYVEAKRSIAQISYWAAAMARFSHLLSFFLGLVAAYVVYFVSPSEARGN